MNGIDEAVKSATGSTSDVGSVAAMADLLRSLLALATDRPARDAFRDDPEGWLRSCGDDLTGEDVIAASDVVAVRVAPDAAARIRGATAAMIDSTWASTTPAAAALAAVEVLCDAVDQGSVAELPRRSTEPVAGTGERIPDRPPGMTKPPHLRAVDGVGTGDHDGSGAASGRATVGSLGTVPAPDGGYRYHVLELVSLPGGIADAGIEPGATATVVAAHPGPPLCYEVEVSNDDGSRRYLGLVAADAVAPLRD